VFSTLEIVEEYQYLLYDFNNFVSAVGGSLGLLLGFCFLQAIEFVSLKVQMFINKNK